MSVGELEVMVGEVALLDEDVENMEVAVSRLEDRPGTVVVRGTVKLEVGKREDEGSGCMKLLVTVEVTCIEEMKVVDETNVTVVAVVEGSGGGGGAVED